MGTVSIKGINKNVLLRYLFKCAKCTDPAKSTMFLTAPVIKTLLDSKGKIDEIKGRVLKINLRGTEIDTTEYNKYNGANLFEDIVSNIIRVDTNKYDSIKLTTYIQNACDDLKMVYRPIESDIVEPAVKQKQPAVTSSTVDTEMLRFISKKLTGTTITYKSLTVGDLNLSAVMMDSLSVINIKEDCSLDRYIQITADAKGLLSRLIDTKILVEIERRIDIVVDYIKLIAIQNNIK